MSNQWINEAYFRDVDISQDIIHISEIYMFYHSTEHSNLDEVESPKTKRCQQFYRKRRRDDTGIARD